MNGKVVDAIEGGKIVKVSEDYARQEGLLILRKSQIGMEERKVNNRLRREIEDNGVRLSMDDFRKPLKKDSNSNLLVDNFHWGIVRKRRELGISRKQLAQDVGVGENKIKMIENGVLPKDGFIVVGEIQNRLGINLKRDRQEFGKQPMRKLIEESREEEIRKKLEIDENDILGDDIEIIEDDL